MPSSDASSSSSLEVIGDSASRSVDEHIASNLRTQREVDELCGRYGVPVEFKARPAGELRMSSPPPPGHVCVCAHALEAGMRVPLHPFFCEVLRHYGLAPTQLMPNGWRNVAGFVVLCHFAGVPLSMPVFRSFFLLVKLKGWYHFRSKDASAGVLFTGTPSSIKNWKQGFFFLSSPAPWPCPVEWGVPPNSSTTELPLTIDEKRSAAKLLRARGSAAIDLRTYLCDRNLAAAMIAAAASAPSPAPCGPTQIPRTTASSKGIDPSVYDVMKTVRAEKAAEKKARTEPPELSPFSGKKRKHDEAEAKDPPAASRGGLGSSMSGAACPTPPGPQNQGAGKPQQEPDRHDGDAAGWEAARKLLRDLVTPSRARVFAAAKPSDVVASSYVALLQAANYATFSLGYAMDAAAEAGALRAELAKSKAELAETKAELAEAEGELEKTKTELAEARKAAAGELQSVRAAAVREYLASMENVRRLAEHALEGYERGMDHMKRVALRLYPRIDAARLVVPPGGSPPPP